jgi:hypothetical protein
MRLGRIVLLVMLTGGPRREEARRLYKKRFIVALSMTHPIRLIGYC